MILHYSHNKLKYKYKCKIVHFILSSERIQKCIGFIIVYPSFGYKEYFQSIMQLIEWKY